MLYIYIYISLLCIHVYNIINLYLILFPYTLKHNLYKIDAPLARTASSKRPYYSSSSINRALLRLY